MKEISSYLYSLVAACILASLGRRMLSDAKHFSAVGNLVIGLFLSFSIFSPLLHIDWKSMEFDAQNTDFTFSQISESAQTYQAEALKQRIKHSTQEYIWSKATSLSMDIKAEVILQEEYPYTPCSVRIFGYGSPYAKKQLADYLTHELGIPKEAQIWTVATS